MFTLARSAERRRIAPAVKTGNGLAVTKAGAGVRDSLQSHKQKTGHRFKPSESYGSGSDTYGGDNAIPVHWLFRKCLVCGEVKEYHDTG